MGEEQSSSYSELGEFLGVNTQLDDTNLDYRECSYMVNFNINDGLLEKRKGSEVFSSNDFLDKTDTNPKNLTGIYEAELNGTIFKIGIGGDAFKQYAAGAWVDKTGAVVITDDDDIHWSFATFFDSAGTPNEIIVACNGVDPMIKWTGAGNADVLANVPSSVGANGVENFPVVHKGKLWVAVGDKVYRSALGNGESWDVVNDVVDDDFDVENITSIKVYNDIIIVFQKRGIYGISGSTNEDLYVRKIVTNDGTESHHSVQEIQSYRYGSILVFLSYKDGILKGFNGSKNTIDLGDNIRKTFRSLNLSRFANSVSAVYSRENKYWLACSSIGSDVNDFVIVYDFKQDVYSSPRNRPLSTFAFYDGSGVNINAFGNWVVDNEEILVTGDYDANLLKQDSGFLDKETDAIFSTWQSSKINFGDFYTKKQIKDIALLTIQYTRLDLSLSVTFSRENENKTCLGSITINPDGPLWDNVNWDEFNWSADSDSTQYTMVPVEYTTEGDEGPMIARFFQFQINHSAPSQELRLQEIIFGLAPRGIRKAYIPS